eukprot:UN25302
MRLFEFWYHQSYKIKIVPLTRLFFIFVKNELIFTKIKGVLFLNWAHALYHSGKGVFFSRKVWTLSFY